MHYAHFGAAEAADPGIREFLQPLVGTTPSIRPFSDFVNIQVVNPLAKIIIRDLYNKEIYNTAKVIWPENWKPSGTAFMKATTVSLDTIDWNVCGFAYEDINLAAHRRYTGTNSTLTTLQNLMMVPKARIDSATVNPYPTSRDFFWTLSWMREPTDFLRLVKLYDFYRVALPLVRTSVGNNTYYKYPIWHGGAYKVKEYRFGVSEALFFDLPDEAYRIFEMLLFGWSLGFRQLAALAAEGLTDSYQLESAYRNIDGIKNELYRLIDEKTTVNLINANKIVFTMDFQLSSNERSKLREVVDKVQRFIEIQKLQLAAKGAVLNTPEMPYTPTAAEKDQFRNVNIVYDPVASEASGTPTFRDISVNYNLQFAAQNKPITDTRIPLAAWQKAPEIQASWSRTNATPEGFAVPPPATGTQRRSMATYILGGIAAAVLISELKG